MERHDRHHRILRESASPSHGSVLPWSPSVQRVAPSSAPAVRVYRMGDKGVDQDWHFVVGLGGYFCYCCCCYRYVGFCYLKGGCLLYERWVFVVFKVGVCYLKGGVLSS